MEKVKINIVPKGLKPACYVSQNDNGRVVRFELFDELTPYTLDGSETITITVVRPDGVELVSSVVNTEDSYIDVVFNDNMTAIAGIADCELTITDGETVIGSRNFDMNIEIDAYNGKDVVIETATGVIASFNTEVEDNALEYESEIPYNAEGYTGLEIINSRTAPAYDKTPYLFRKTPSGYGNSCIEKLNGLSVAFNQLLENGDFSTLNGWSFNSGTGAVANNKLTFTITEAAASNSIYCSLGAKVIQGHKYFVSAFVTPSKNAIFQSRVGNAVAPTISISANTRTNIKDIIVGDDSETKMFMIYCNRQVLMAVGDTCVYENAFCIDLTQMFGSTIADYLYNLETQTVGAGVQKFKELGFDAPYYPYNIGSLMSSKPTAKKVIGKNQLNIDNVEIGTTWNGSSNSARARLIIPCFPNTNYVLTMSGTMSVDGVYFGESETIPPSGIGAVTFPKVFTTLSTSKYITLGFNKTSIAKSDIEALKLQLEFGSTATAYEPYSEETYNLGGDELRGLLKLDANNNIYADGDVKTSDGNNKRKYGFVIYDGSDDENWYAESGYTNRFAISTGLSNISSQYANFISNYLKTSLWGTTDYTFALKTNGSLYVSIDTSATQMTVTEFKTYLSNHNLQIQYELETPTTESADPFTDPQEARITEEFIDNRAIPIPVGHDTIYGTDIEYQDIDFDTTIFGGDINAIDGVLTSRYNSDGSVKTTPDVIELDPALIPVKAGDNNIFNSASGAQTIRYYNQED